MKRFVGPITCAAALVAAGVLLAGGAHAGGTKYSSNIVELQPVVNTTNFHLLKPGKVGFKSTIAPGLGGLVTQLILSNVDCPLDPKGNDAGIAGKCGPKTDPVTDHAMELGISFGGLDITGAAGLLYDLKQGKAIFQATGKNSAPGNVLGPTVTLVFNKPLGIGVIRLHEAGSDPSDCHHSPLTPTDGCIDGVAYAIAGVVVGDDSTLHCTNNTQCALTAVCHMPQGVCQPEPCTTDANCDQDGTGNGGTGQCGSDGQCCDPTFDSTCIGQVP